MSTTSPVRPPLVDDSDWLRIERVQRGIPVALRLNNESGFFRIKRSRGGWTAEFCRNFHYVNKSRVAKAVAHLQRRGWRVNPRRSAEPGAMIASLAGSPRTFEALRTVLKRAFGAILRRSDGEVFVDLETRPLRHIPHACTFWDWKEPPPFGDFEKAVRRLIGDGAKAIYFTDHTVDSDTYFLTISSIRPTQYEADRYSDIAAAEMPSSGGRLTFCYTRKA